MNINKIENNEYKTAKEIICDLVDIVSKNGSLLLNIGPKSDGTIRVIWTYFYMTFFKKYYLNTYEELFEIAQLMNRVRCR